MDLGIARKVALVAGASQGIGRAVARVLAQEGAKVALFARSEHKLQEAAEEVSGIAVRVDLTDRDATRAALERVTAELGAPTIFVHAAAAVYEPKKLQYAEPEEIDRLLATDLLSAVDLSRLVLPEMMAARYGRIILLGSIAARTGVAGGTMYAVAKAGLEGLARGIALDDSRRGITANVVAIAFADTERLALRTEGDHEARERLVRATATRRIPTSDEIAEVVAFLASERASSITGAVIDATAGGHLNNLW